MHLLFFATSLALVIGLCARDPLLGRAEKGYAALLWLLFGGVGIGRAMYVGDMPTAGIFSLFSLAYLVICLVSLGRPALVMGDLIVRQAEAEGRPVPAEVRARVHRTQIAVVSAVATMAVLVAFVAPQMYGFH